MSWIASFIHSPPHCFLVCKGIAFNLTLFVYPFLLYSFISFHAGCFINLSKLIVTSASSRYWLVRTAHPMMSLICVFYRILFAFLDPMGSFLTWAHLSILVTLRLVLRLFGVLEGNLKLVSR